jgi:hypothetical protein
MQQSQRRHRAPSLSLRQSEPAVTQAEKDFFSASSNEPRLFPSTAPQNSAPAALFESDSPLAPDKYTPPRGLAVLLGRIAEFARFSGAPTPFAIGLLAPAGGGKSSALGWVAARIAVANGPALARLDASALAAEPERALAAALYHALASTQGALVKQAAREAEHFGADAGAVARKAQERAERLRGQLIAARRTHAESQARRAALPETVLFDSPGSRVDGYARRMRGAFESRMRGFGLKGDALLTFKDMTRDLATHEGFPARLLASLRAHYAYRGQVSLLVYAVLFYLLSQGVDWLAVNKADWLAWLGHLHDAGAQTADFLRARLGFLGPVSSLLLLAALGCVARNLWRAHSFSRPLLRAAALLDEDVATQAQALDQALAHQEQGVDQLGAEVAAAAWAAGEADRRAEAAGASKNPPAFLERDAEAHRRDHALGFLHGLSSALEQGKAGPRRLVVAVDGFENAQDAGALFERLCGLLARPGFVALYALEPSLCAAETQARLLQLPLRLDAVPPTPPALAPLDAPISPLEERLLGAMTPLVGNMPRAKKRLRNFYGFLRPAEPTLAPALAFELAVGLGGDSAERAALATALRGESLDAFLKAPRLTEALATARDIAGPATIENLSKAAPLAATLASR